ncbi:NS5c protein [Bottlenose dolphin coronavirus HKU22]|uniref:NS5c protein n=1 Tax=Bottlenose dolphin coronavirus HKU22 TaxID=1433215 RepID=V5TGX8_BWCOV|nr:NS5c protein [Bottlenose dolphin coronavirus HKU22]AHB63513.1 NS5c protein [Bottlenose dolphin coronavirus HKU22]
MLGSKFYIQMTASFSCRKWKLSLSPIVRESKVTNTYKFICTTERLANHLWGKSVKVIVHREIFNREDCDGHKFYESILTRCFNDDLTDEAVHYIMHYELMELFTSGWNKPKHVVKENYSSIILDVNERPITDMVVTAVAKGKVQNLPSFGMRLIMESEGFVINENCIGNDAYLGV